MMTFGWSDRRKEFAAGGFTLLEIVVVMAVMVMLFSVVAFAYRAEARDPSVRAPANDLVRIAKTAVRAAAVQGRGFSIAFDKQGFALAGADLGQRSRVNVPKGMKIHLKRWGARDWEEAVGHRWWFGSQGLCEPLSIRFAAEDAVLEMKFNPLTGTPSEEQIEIF